MALESLRDDPALRGRLGLLARLRVHDSYSSAVTVEGLMRNYERMALRKLAVA